ncbi:MAG: methyltransferase domain-containing protein [Pseudomonadota bacterium]
MRPHIEDLIGFYDSPLGQHCQRLLQRRLSSHWQKLAGCRVLVLGYGVPLLPSLASAERVTLAMSASQGAQVLSQEQKAMAPAQVVLCPESKLPLADVVYDHVVMVHSLEFAEKPGRFLREVWRVMADGGRLLAVVPNRLGFWASFESTPFGNGRPFAKAQLEGQLASALLSPLVWESLLHVPPMNQRSLVGLSAKVEPLGRALWPALGGVHVVEVEKTVYGATSSGVEPAQAVRVANPALAIRTAARAAVQESACSTAPEQKKRVSA